MKCKLVSTIFVAIGIILTINSGYASGILLPITVGDKTFVVPFGSSSFKTTRATYAEDEIVSVVVNTVLSGDRDWVGVYPKNASNDWGNVVEWHFVTKGQTALNKITLPMPEGEYEVRLFFHNSYHMEARYGFTVSNGPAVGNSEYGLYTAVGPEKPNDELIYTYKPQKNGFVRTNAPVVIFLAGGLLSKTVAF